MNSKPFFKSSSDALWFLLCLLLLALLPWITLTMGGYREKLFQSLSSKEASFPTLQKGLFQDKQEIDYALFGACTTWWQLIPEAMQTAWPQTSTPVILNFGINHFGAEADYVLVKDLLQNRKVKHLVLSSPRFNDGADFPHPNSYLWWNSARDGLLLPGLSWQDHLRLYAVSVIGSFRLLPNLLLPSSQQEGPDIYPSGAFRRTGSASSPPASKLDRLTDLQGSEFVFDQKRAGELNQIAPLPANQKAFLQEILRLAKEKGVPVLLVSSPLKDDWRSENLNERENWFAMDPQIKVIGVPPPSYSQPLLAQRGGRFFYGRQPEY